MKKLSIELTKEELEILSEALLKYRVEKAKDSLNKLYSLKSEDDIISSTKELNKINTLEIKVSQLKNDLK